MAKTKVKRKPSRPGKSKPVVKKPIAKKPAKRATAKKPLTRTAASKRPLRRKTTAASATRIPWFDAGNSKPLISEYAQRLQPFMDTMADGRVDDAELQAQEDRLIAAMKEVEPMLAGPLHGKVTRLLCEMAAYDLMQVLRTVQESRPKTVFRG